jgi:hypothetical protein
MVAELISKHTKVRKQFEKTIESVGPKAVVAAPVFGFAEKSKGDLLADPPAIHQRRNETPAVAARSAIVRRGAVLTAITAALAIGLSASARAATIVVDSLTDSGAAGICALRDAITAANTMTATNGCGAGTGSDTIQFSVTGTIPLASTLPQVTDALLTIQGPPAPGVTLKLDSLTFANGSTTDCVCAGFGGAIFNQGKLTVTNSTFSGNSGFELGGIAGAVDNEATLTVSNSTFSGNNSLSGGAIYNFGNLTVTDSTFSDNIGGDNFGDSGFGGAIFNAGGMTVTGSTFVGNNLEFGTSFGGFGGAIFSQFKATIINSTFVNNSVALSRGGGGAIAAFGGLQVTNSTFVGNSSAGLQGGGAILSPEGGTSLRNTILANSSPKLFLGNCAPASLAGGAAPISDAGYNISDDNSCGFAATGSLNNTDPQLSPAGLANNGGPTQTIALLIGSPAIDTIPLASCTDQSSPPKAITADQRGFPRPDAAENVCDIGAYEFQDFAGQPGAPNCHGKSVSALSNQYGGLDAAAAALGYPSVKALQDAIRAFC